MEEFRMMQRMNDQKGTAVVVGGGFIGVEWATEMKAVFTDIDVLIVNRPPNILCRWPVRAIEYAQAHLDRTEGIRCVFGTVYDPADPDMFEKIGLDAAPSAVYACTGVQPSVKFLPSECLTRPGEVEGDRHGEGPGWVRVNKKL